LAAACPYGTRRAAAEVVLGDTRPATCADLAEI
jgi:hypothetical protein